MDNEEKTSWQYNPDGSTNISGEMGGNQESSSREKPEETPLTWTASEYIDHNNGMTWYALLLAGTLTLSGVIYFLTKDMLATGTILILGIVVGIAAARRPQQINYELTSAGIKIGGKSYSFNSYRSFYIIKDGALHSISLMPLKRFSPALSVYFDPGHEEQIIEKLSHRLPFEEHEVDFIEKLSRRLRF